MSSSSNTSSKGFTVRGIHFRSPAEARASARRLREDAEEHARAMRREGNEAAAEKVTDQANEQADAYDLAAAEHDQKPTKVAQRPAAQRGGKMAAPRRSSSRRGRSSSGRGGSLFGRAGSRLASASTGSAGDVIEQLILATILVAFLSVFLNARGASAFGWLAGGVSKLLELIVSPVDPLGKLGSSADPFGSGGSTAAASAGAEKKLGQSTGITPARRKRSPVVVTTGRGGH